jgi:hypothetical protein
MLYSPMPALVKIFFHSNFAYPLYCIAIHFVVSARTRPQLSSHSVLCDTAMHCRYRPWQHRRCVAYALLHDSNGHARRSAFVLSTKPSGVKVVWSISCLTYGISIPSGVFIPSVRLPPGHVAVRLDGPKLRREAYAAKLFAPRSFCPVCFPCCCAARRSVCCPTRPECR